MPEESRASSAVSAMSEAASTGRSAVIQWWFASGQEAKLKPQRPTASILLECAGQYGYPQLMEYLLAHGASVNEFEGKGATPLHGCASWIGSSALVSAQCLIKHGAHINARVAGYPIADTIRLRLPGRSQPDAVTGQQTLEETEADFGGPIRSGYTPLMLAAENGNYKMMALLRRYHANERLKSPYGETASAIAARVLLHDIDEALFYPPPPPFRGGFATF
jgi:ankyrin repeat protein